MRCPGPSSRTDPAQRELFFNDVVNVANGNIASNARARR